MPIRDAQPSDMDRILEMGQRSMLDGPYRDEGFNRQQCEITARGIMEHPKGKILLSECLVSGAEHIFGLLGFLVYPHYYTGEPIASELMWYIEPEHRQSFAAIALLRAGERIAREMGAKKMQFTAPSEEVARAYELMGYRKLETAYQKSL